MIENMKKKLADLNETYDYYLERVDKETNRSYKKFIEERIKEIKRQKLLIETVLNGGK